MCYWKRRWQRVSNAAVDKVNVRISFGLGCLEETYTISSEDLFRLFPRTWKREVMQTNLWNLIKVVLNKQFDNPPVDLLCRYSIIISIEFLNEGS